MADKNEGGSGVALDEALKQLKTATPEARKAHLMALRAVMDEAGDPDDEDEAKKKAKEAADAEEEEEKKKAEEKAAADAAEEEAKKKEAAEDAKHGMDAAEVQRQVAEAIKTHAASIKRRDTLAKQLGAHVGTFDHSEMSESDVVAYGVKKLGITVAAGQEAGVLQGFLLAAGKTPVAKTANAMDAGEADFVTAYLTKKEG